MSTCSNRVDLCFKQRSRPPAADQELANQVNDLWQELPVRTPKCVLTVWGINRMFQKGIDPDRGCMNLFRSARL